MSYSDYDLKTALETFGLEEDRRTDLFSAVDSMEPSEFLLGWLRQFAPIALGVGSEKARSEYIIAPVLAEAQRRAGTEINVLPGVTLDVDRERGLTGFCDYVLARSPEFYFLKAPLLAVVEAKREDIVGGLGQCTAEMVAIQLFNERERTPLETVYGCVTSGNVWRFLKLEKNKLWVDLPEYHLRDVAKILGIVVNIARG